MDTAHMIIMALCLVIVLLMYQNCQTPTTVVKKVKGDCPACDSCCPEPVHEESKEEAKDDSHEQNKSGEYVVYGTTWCGFTVKQLDLLKSKDVKFKFVDCEKEQCLPDIQGFPVTIAPDGKRYDGFSNVGLD